jgi:putative transposase
MSITQIVTIIKSVTAKEIFKLYPEIKKQLYGGNFWTNGFYANTVGEYANKEVIMNYVKNQGMNEKDYNKIHSGQMSFDF